MRDESVIPDAEILESFLAGSSSATDAARVNAWAGRTQAGVSHADIVREVLAGIGNAATDPKEHVAALRLRINERSYAQRRSWGSLRKYLWLPVAIIVAAFGIKYVTSGSPSAQSKTYSTSTGQRATVTLATGAQVTLAPMTTLRVTGNDAELRGQAVFTVLHHSDSPFTVRTSSATIRVLGTMFVVRAYNEQTRVGVADGKISVNGPTVLSVGDIAEVAATGTRIERKSDITSLLRWTNGDLVFTSAPFRDVISEIERWYGLKMTVTDQALLNRRITTTLTTEPPAKVIELLSSALSAKVSHNGQYVQFSPAE